MEFPDRMVAAFGSPPRREPYARADWAQVEGLIGGEVPPDYQWFVDSYGPSVICGHLYLDAPISPRGIVQSVSNGRAMLRAWIDADVPCPEDLRSPDEVFSWGYSDWDGDLFFFKMTGPAKEWPIILLGRQPQRSQRFEISFLEFLLQYAEPSLAGGGGPAWRSWSGS